MRRSRKQQAGFTLVELMIVVAIIGVLAAIAVPSFSAYVLRSRASEATTFLGEIRQRQESYRSEFGQYAAVSDSFDASEFIPSGAPDRQPKTWPADPGAWGQLGASPDGPVRFVYACIAGAPSDDPPDSAVPGGFANNDFWFVAQAVGDLDADGEQITFEAYWASNNIWRSNAKGWE